MIINFLRLALFAFVIAALSGCKAPIIDQASVYEVLFDEIDGLDRTYYVRELQVRAGYPIEDRFQPDRLSEYGLSEYAFPIEISTHTAMSFGGAVVSFVSESEFVELFELSCPEGWDRFHERYPDAGDLITLSQIGFNGRADKAVVSVSVARGCLNARGGLYYLEKQSGLWVVTGVEFRWEA